YNAVSPNNDGKNEFFDIRYIDLLPDTQENKVTIYNRWGTVVFEVENYNEANAFRGLTSSGNEVPSGTYFYKIEFTNGRSSITGYLSLKR
ncbi:MAG: gliding motility-associated C-terminal domain-containing protein, partial [Cyclobacteriaceae bacterium]|nr:gliding motility-associated C-terminal domain-containing protein [Cyclobacteriaceae bacterium]